MLIVLSDLLSFQQRETYAITEFQTIRAQTEPESLGGRTMLLTSSTGRQLVEL